MSKVTTINSNGITPEVVLESVAEHLKNMKQMYVVGFDEDGDPMVWSTGHMGGLSCAALVLQDLALKYLNGCITEEHERGGD